MNDIFSISRRGAVGPLLLAVAAGCAHPRVPADGAPDVALGDTARVMLGGHVTFDRARVRVAFDSLVSDSRCPKNTQCVWAGDAVPRLRVATHDATLAVVLHTTLDPKRAWLDGYEIALLDVTPYPGTEPPNARLAPTVVLRVTRR